MDKMKFLKPEQYQQTANQLFEQLKTRLQGVLPTAQIEHVGSSAIGGCVSKGDLDIYVAVNKDEFPTAIAAVESLGFSIKQGTLRTEELCPFEGNGYALDVGIQLVARGSKFEFFLIFRDALSADPKLREE